MTRLVRIRQSDGGYVTCDIETVNRVTREYLERLDGIEALMSRSEALTNRTAYWAILAIERARQM